MISHIYYAILNFFAILPKVLCDKVEHSRGCTSYSALRKDTATDQHCLETIQVCHCFAFYTCDPASISVSASIFTTASPYADLVYLGLLPTVLPLPPRAVVIPMCWHTRQCVHWFSLTSGKGHCQTQLFICESRDEGGGKWELRNVVTLGYEYRALWPWKPGSPGSIFLIHI